MLLLSILVIASLVTVASAREQDLVVCSEASRLARLDVLIDPSSITKSSSFHWSLVCNSDRLTWDSTLSGNEALQEATYFRAAGWHIQDSCIDMRETCEFRIGAESGTFQFYTLTYGATTVARWPNDDESPVESVYCFGPSCGIEKPSSDPNWNGQGRSSSWKYFFTRKSFLLWFASVALAVTSTASVVCLRLRERKRGIHFREVDAAATWEEKTVHSTGSLRS